MRNLKLAFRTLFKTPFVAVVAILSLALGIGANAAIFSLFDELLLQPLPVTDPARLANFKAPGPQYGSNSCNDAGDCDEVFSYPMLRDLQKANTAFSGIAGHFLLGVSVAMSGQTPVSGRGLYVTGNYFSVLGLRPALGRLFTPRDDETIGGNYRRRAELPVLGNSARIRPERRRQADHDQRPADDDHRCRAEGLHRHDARLATVRLRADHHAQRPDARLEGI